MIGKVPYKSDKALYVIYVFLVYIKKLYSKISLVYYVLYVY